MIIVKRIEAYSLWDFAKGVQEAVKEGYVVSDTNENFPQQFGTFYTCGVIKEDTTQESLSKTPNQAYKTTSDEGSTQGTPDQENVPKAVPEPSKAKGKAKG